MVAASKPAPMTPYQRPSQVSSVPSHQHSAVLIELLYTEPRYSKERNPCPSGITINPEPL